MEEEHLEVNCLVVWPTVMLLSDQELSGSFLLTQKSITLEFTPRVHLVSHKIIVYVEG